MLKQQHQSGTILASMDASASIIKHCDNVMQDVTAGSCFQTNELLEGGDFGAKMSGPDHQAFTQCGFKSMEGFELTEQLECSVCTPRSTLYLSF